LQCSKLVDALNTISPIMHKRMGRIWEVPEKYKDIILFKKEFKDEKIDPYQDLEEILDINDFYEENK